MYKPKITQVLDPSHASWVQGGVFADLRRHSESFNTEEIYLPAPNAFKVIWDWVKICLVLGKQERLLFSSLTPLENYSKFPLRRTKQSIGLWFTHKEGDFTKRERKAMRLADTIFVHSTWEGEKIARATSSKQVVMLAALDTSRFPRASTSEKRIVWAGTSVKRKRPNLFLDLVETRPDLQFLLIGHSWSKHPLFQRVTRLKNLVYKEFEGPLGSELLDGCDLYLMTSEFEGGPMPLMETLAAGIVPICTRTGFVEAIFEFTDLPKKLIVEPNLDAINEAIQWVRDGNFKISSETRDKILSLSFNRLANLIEANLP
jgi:glycosyltransferase involved in cell wall biosynthesis